MRSQVSQEQIAADPRHDGRDIALEARNIPDRQAEADKGRWIENVDILQVGCAARHPFEIFMPRSEIGIRCEALVLFALRRREAIAPEQDLLGKLLKFRLRREVDGVARTGNREIECEFTLRRARNQMRSRNFC
jgi:hypothetical protein